MNDFIDRLLVFLKNNKKTILLIAGLLVVIVWLSGRSYISIETSGGQGEYEYTLQRGSKSKTTKSNSPSKRFFVPKGNYEIVARSQGKNFVAIKQTSGFMIKTTIKGDLQDEKQIKYVGDEPKSCMFYSSSILKSYECMGNYGESISHIPSNASAPTYTLKQPYKDVDGKVEGTINTKDGPLMLLKSFYSRELEVRNGHYLEKVNDTLGIVSENELTALDNDKEYFITNYKDGFLVYSHGYDEFYYFPSYNSQPQKISIEGAKKEGLFPIKLSVSDDSISLVYVNSLGDVKGKDSVSSPKTEVVVYKGGQQKQEHYFMPIDYRDGQLCQKDSLCMVTDDGTLDVYTISKDKSKRIYQQYGVVDVRGLTDGNVLVVKENAAYVMDPKKSMGSIDFDFGHLEYGSAQSYANTYLLAMKSPDSKRVAIIVDRSKPSDDINEKFYDLQRKPFVNTATLSGDYIYIMPSLGQAEWNPATGIFEYSATKKKETNDEINNFIKERGFDTSKYKIINIYAP